MRARNVVAGGAAAALLAAAGYGTMTYYRFGREPRGRSRNPLLDAFIPHYDVRERHEAEVLAPAALTWAAARGLDFQRSPLIRGIVRARELLMGVRAAPEQTPTGPFLDQVLAIGWRVLAEDPDRWMVCGAAAQPWKADVVFRGVAADEFAAFDEPDWVKIAWTVEVVRLDESRSLFRTETRAAATDPGARARFRRYWTLVRPGIVLIRREMLRLVKKEAESRALDVRPHFTLPSQAVR